MKGLKKRLGAMLLAIVTLLTLCLTTVAAADEAAATKMEAINPTDAPPQDAEKDTTIPDLDVYALHKSGNYRYIGKMTADENEVAVTDVTGNPVTDAVITLQADEVYVLCYATPTEATNSMDAPDGAGQTICVDGNSAKADYTIEIKHKSYTNMAYISEGSMALMEGVRRLLSENSGYSDVVALGAQAQAQYYEIANLHSIETARIAVNGATMNVVYYEPINDGLSVLGGHWAQFIRSITPNVQSAVQTVTQVTQTAAETAPEAAEAAEEVAIVVTTGAAGAATAAGTGTATTAAGVGETAAGSAGGVVCLNIFFFPAAVWQCILARAPGAGAMEPTMN